MYLVIGLSGILAINLLAFVISIGVLLFVDIPEPPKTAEGRLSHTKFPVKLCTESNISSSAQPAGSSNDIFTGNLFSGIALSAAVLYPMILLRTNNDPAILGVLQSAGALAARSGRIFLTTWGGIKRPARAIIVAWLISSLFGMTLQGLVRPC